MPPSARPLWIRRLENTPTHHVGTASSAAERIQFFGTVVATLPSTPVSVDWSLHKRWYAVLHRFNHAGKHIGTDSWFAGVTADGEDAVIAAARQRLASWLGSMRLLSLQDIFIRPFSVEIEGHMFGLINVSKDRGYPSYLIAPNDLLFHEPWNGHYDT